MTGRAWALFTAMSALWRRPYLLIKVVAALCYAISALLIKGLMDVPRLASVTATLTIAGVLILPFATTRMPQRLPDAPVIAALLILSEPLTLGTMVGFVLIVLGCALATGGVRFPRRFSEGHKIAGTGAELVHGRTS